MGRGRGRARARSPTRPVITSSGRRSPTRSRSPERGSSSPSTSSEASSSAAGVDKRMETLALGQSSSSSSVSSATGVGAQDEPGIRGAKRGARDEGGLALRGDRYDHDDCVKSRPEGKDKIGKKGTVIPIKANYYEVKTAPTWALYEYRVDFTPMLDHTYIRKKLFKAVAKDSEKPMDFGYLFDGNKLYTPEVFGEGLDPNDGVILNVVDSKDGIPYEIRIKAVGKLETGSPDYIKIYNLLLRRCMYALNMEPMGRNFFDPTAAIELPTQRLTLWPGKFSLSIIIYFYYHCCNVIVCLYFNSICFCMCFLQVS